MARLAGRLEAKWVPAPGNRLTMILGGFYDGVYDLRRDDYSATTRQALGSGGELRELYWDTGHGDWLLRLGKQQVTWGQGDYFRVLDVINPVEMRDFILSYVARFEDARRPLWMINAAHQGESVETQFLLIPQFRHTLLAPVGADFGLSPGALQGLTGPTQEDPDVDLFNPAYGLRVSGSSEAGFDWAGYLYSGYNPDPFLAVEAAEGRAELTYHPRRLVGASWSVPVANIVLRGDLAYYWKEPYQGTHPERDPAPTSDTWAALLGVDYVEKHWTVNAQYGIKRLLNSIDIQSAQTQQDASLFVQWQTLDERRKLSLLLMHKDDVVESGMAKWAGTFQPHADWKWTLGYIAFYGDRAGQFGQYGDQDRYFTEIEYVF